MWQLSRAELGQHIKEYVKCLKWHINVRDTVVLICVALNGRQHRRRRTMSPSPLYENR